MRTKVEEEDPTDLLPKVAAEKMTRRLLRGCQLEVVLYCFRHLSKDFCQELYVVTK